VDFLTGVADLAWSSLMRGKSELGWRFIQRGLERTAIDGSESRLAQGHTYRCYAGPLLARLGRTDEGRRHLEEFRALLDEYPNDRWRRGQWLAHWSLYHAVAGSARHREVLEEAFAAFHAIGFSPQRVPLQLRQFYVA